MTVYIRLNFTHKKKEYKMKVLNICIYKNGR